MSNHRRTVRGEQSVDEILDNVFGKPKEPTKTLDYYTGQLAPTRENYAACLMEAVEKHRNESKRNKG